MELATLELTGAAALTVAEPESLFWEQHSENGKRARVARKEKLGAER